MRNPFLVLGLSLMVLTATAQDSLRWELLDAAFAGDSLRTATLLSSGADPDASTADSITALMYAVDGGALPVAKLLLGAGADPGKGASWQEAPLITAVRKADLLMLGLLLDAGAQTDIRDAAGMTALMHSSRLNDVLIAWILIKEGARIEAADADSCRAVHHAAANGSYEALAFLLDTGAIADVRDISGITPAMLVAARGDIAMLELLMKQGADPMTRDRNGLNYLDHAILHHQDGVVAFVLDIGHPDSGSRESASGLALRTGQRSIYRMIRETGPGMKRPVTLGYDLGLSVIWNGKDHFASLRAGWTEARTNLRLGLSWSRRITPVRVLSSMDGSLYQFREKRNILAAGIQKRLSFPLSGMTSFRITPGGDVGITWQSYRGTSLAGESAFHASASLETGIFRPAGGIIIGLRVINTAQEEISPLYLQAGITLNLKSYRYKKYSPLPRYEAYR